MKGHKTGLEISYPCKSVSRDGSPQAQLRKVSFDSDPFLEIMYLNLGYNVKIFKRLLLYEINVLDVIMALLTLHLNVSLLLFKMRGFVSYWTQGPGVRCQPFHKK